MKGSNAHVYHQEIQTTADANQLCTYKLAGSVSTEHLLLFSTFDLMSCDQEAPHQNNTAQQKQGVCNNSLYGL